MKLVGPILALCAVLAFSAQGAFAETAPGFSTTMLVPPHTCKTSDQIHCASNQNDPSISVTCITLSNDQTSGDYTMCDTTKISNWGGGGGGFGGAGGGFGGAGGGFGGGFGGAGFGAGLVGLAGLAGLSAVIVNSNKPASP